MKSIGLIAIIIGIIFSSCNTEQRLAHKCAMRFPVKDSVVEKQVYLPGKTIFMKGDTVTVNCDSIVKINQQSGQPSVKNIVHLVKVPCPTLAVQVDTFYSTKTIQIENTAKVTDLQNKLDAANKKNDSINVWKKIFMWWAFGATLLIILYIIFKNFLKIPGVL